MVDDEHIVGEAVDYPADGVGLEQLQRTPHQLPQHVFVQLGPRSRTYDLSIKYFVSSSPYPTSQWLPFR